MTEHILEVFGKEDTEVINIKEDKKSMKKIQEKLNKIQTELKAPKGQYNSFGKYAYRSCEDIMEGVKPLLKETKTTLIISDKVVQVGDRYYVEATATLSDGEDSITVTASAREEENKKGMDGSQVTGASSSYARKYALNGLFAIDDTKDADATNNHGKITDNSKPKNEVDKPSSSQISLIKKLIKDKGISKDDELKALKGYGVGKIEDLSKSNASAIIKKLQG